MTKKKPLTSLLKHPQAPPYKYACDNDLQLLKLKKILPFGLAFPFDFGFVPNTIGGDGDPLDVLVIADNHLFPGCLLSCRLLGVLEAVQQQGKKHKERNDRIIAVASNSVKYAGVVAIGDLNKSLVQELENFFVNYNRHDGKVFTPKRWANAKVALKLITQSVSHSVFR